jgi:DNA (cytosine-5)-methyltransferase 1
MRKNNFPSMAESGWLTRSLEQNVPYEKNYTGKISGKGLKESFLHLYDTVQTHESPINILAYFFQQLVKKRDTSQIQLSTPANLTVSETLNLMRNHFEYNYRNVSGASRLPNIAIYAAYKSVIDGNQTRYRNKSLCPLDSHTAADSSTGSIGDIQINNENGQPFEGLEIKAKQLSSDMVDVAYIKIQGHSTVERYYILSTFEDVDKETQDEITSRIIKIRSKHGCEVIVNGVFTTLKYFLRLVDSDMFIRFYVEQIKHDDALKYEHKMAWNEICSSL